MRRLRQTNDDDCTIGISAMVMFITSVMLAALISFTIIRLTEGIAQDSEKAAEDVRRDVANSVIITGAWVFDNYDDMLFMMEFGATGDPIAREDVLYVLTCTESDGDFYYRSAALGASAGGSPIYVWAVGTDGPINNPTFANVDNFQPGARYFFTLDGGTQGDPTDNKCGPVHLDTEGINANLWLHIPNGPSTHQILSLSNGREIGSQII